MHIGDVLTSESALSVIGMALGAVWALFKSSEWYARFKGKRGERAVLVIEAAVEETYRVYVQVIKEGRADGRLTEEEKQHARTLAKERALAIAREQGVDLARELGNDFVELWLTKIVNRFKLA